MDMRRHLKRFLNDTELKRLDGQYEGIISAVVEEPLRNKFTGSKAIEPIIHFDDGFRLVPNITQRKTLIEIFGPETSDWIGKRIGVFRHPVPRTTKSGTTVTRYEKRIVKVDDGVVAFTRRHSG